MYKRQDVDIIGQFGVGFYSAFMVASKVHVVSKAYGSDEAWAWESDGVEGYTIEEAQREGHGTDVILTLKDNTDDDNYDTFLSEFGLRNLIKRYSNCLLYTSRSRARSAPPSPRWARRKCCANRTPSPARRTPPGRMRGRT